MKKALLVLMVAVVLIGSVYARAEESEDAGAIIGEAMEAYAWVAMASLDVDIDHPDSSGERFLVLDERYNTRVALDAKLAEYFTPEIIDALWSWGAYIEENGFLYAPMDAWRNIDEQISEVQYAVKSEADDVIVYEVTVHYLTADNEVVSEVYEFVRELIDGRWLYTEFPFFW